MSTKATLAMGAAVGLFLFLAIGLSIAVAAPGRPDAWFVAVASSIGGGLISACIAKCVKPARVRGVTAARSGPGPSRRRRLTLLTLALAIGVLQLLTHVGFAIYDDGFGSVGYIVFSTAFIVVGVVFLRRELRGGPDRKSNPA